MRGRVGECVRAFWVGLKCLYVCVLAFVLTCSVMSWKVARRRKDGRIIKILS